VTQWRKYWLPMTVYPWLVTVCSELDARCPLRQYCVSSESITGPITPLLVSSSSSSSRSSKLLLLLLLLLLLCRGGNGIDCWDNSAAASRAMRHSRLVGRLSSLVGWPLSTVSSTVTADCRVWLVMRDQATIVSHSHASLSLSLSLSHTHTLSLSVRRYLVVVG